jgi:hypothetical protein
MHGPFSARRWQALLAAGGRASPPWLSYPPLRSSNLKSSLSRRARGRSSRPVTCPSRLGGAGACLRRAPARVPGSVEQLAALRRRCLCCLLAHRIPPELLALPRHGFLNLHPSLLPAYRGPHPLFWALRDGLRESGVTVHWMAESWIAATSPLQRPTTASRKASEPRYWNRLPASWAGSCSSTCWNSWPRATPMRHPQPSGGSYQPAPRAADFMPWTLRGPPSAPTTSCAARPGGASPTRYPRWR